MPFSFVVILSTEGAKSDNLLEYFAISTFNTSASDCSDWLLEISGGMAFSFALAISYSRVKASAMLFILSSSLTLSDSPAEILSVISCNCVFFFSAAFANLPSISLNSSTESPNSIAFVKSDILLPKSSAIEPLDGSNNSPSAETVLYPCLASMYAFDEDFTRTVSENRNAGNLS